MVNMLRHGHALSLQGVIGADYFQVELRADPHRVGIDEFLAYEGSAVAA